MRGPAVRTRAPRDRAARCVANGQARSYRGLPFLTTQLAAQPRLCEPPIASDRIDGYVECLGCLLGTQPTEKPHLHHLTLPRINRLERLQRIVKRHEVSA